MVPERPVPLRLGAPARKAVEYTLSTAAGDSAIFSVKVRMLTFFSNCSATEFDATSGPVRSTLY
jgi:hypothetical protein